MPKPANMTPVRCDVLDILVRARQPLAAYAILEQLRHGAKKPQTVYRALDYLIACGSVHRLESLNAYVACQHCRRESHHAGFLICRQCLKVCELNELDALEQLIQAYGSAAGFSELHSTMEIRGLCAACTTPKITSF
jgi:Fur family transcriptional regulator, zinc uptake regulator